MYYILFNFKFKVINSLILLILISKLNALYEGQPKFISKNGNLIIESAKDKHITLRTVGKGRIFANDLDLMTNQMIISPHQPTEWSNIINNLNGDTLQDDKQIKTILNNLVFNISRLDNVTTLQRTDLRRLTTRVNRINRDLLRITRNLRTNQCEENQCKNGGTCIPMYDKFLCVCTHNWQGPTCETDVDECAQFLKIPNMGCQNEALCENTPGAYNCRCKGGFFGIHCTEKEKDCLKSSARELCDHGSCLNTRTGIECICDQGWKKNEVTGACTVDINECDTNTNPCHSTCINVPGTFYCGPCPHGFTGNGFVCKDIDECQINNGGCSQRVKCINTIGSYHCGQCPPGYSGDGFNCEMSETTACEIYKPCSPFADCRMISGVPICTCKSGYIGNGQVCSRVSNPCIPNPCFANERCEQRPSAVLGYKCITNSPCLVNPCRNGGTCTLKGSSYECLCPHGFAGRRCLTIENEMCNKIFNDDTGTLNLMNYSPDSNCYYIIQTNDTKILNITINKFNLKNSTDCSKTFIQIHNGKNSGAPGFGRYCGDKLPKNGQFYTSHNFLYIWFKSDNTPSNINLGIQLSWTSVDPICGGEYTFENNLKSSGIISSPNWPNLSPTNRDCSWNFLAPNGKKIVFRILDLKLGGTESECNDYLQIRTGDNDNKLCTSSINPVNIETASNFGEINFHTDQYATDSLFQLHYEIIDGISDCGGIFEETNGQLKSPQTHSPTHKAITCQYLIRQPIDTQILIQFDTFELPGLFNCTAASLEIYDGKNENSPLLLRKCNSEIPSPIKSSGNTLMLRYKYLDGFPHSIYDGFKAQYKLICEHTFENSTGEILSPGYPKPYLNGLDCIYEIRAPLHHIISLTTEKFSLSNSKMINCDIEMDNVQIFANIQNFTRYCQNPSNVILSKNNYMKIEFHSVNNFDKAEGFKFSYKFENIGCGGVFTNNEGTISTLNTRMTNHFCEWIIMPPENFDIQLTYEEFNFNNKNDSTNCKNGLYQFENFTNGDSIKTEICHKLQTKDITTSNLITLIQKIDEPLRNDEGFTVNFEVSNSTCGGTINAAFGELKSPGYPNEYTNNLDCIWIITAPDGHQIELKPLNFSLEMITDNCGEDYLEIRNGKSKDSPLIGRFCGTTIPSRIPSHANHLYVLFHTDYSLQYTGFIINYEQTATGCGGNIDSYEGSIHSPHYPDISHNGALCNWLITVSAGSTITATITMDAGTNNICDKNKLLIFDGGSVSYNKIPFNCTTGTDINIYTITKTFYSTSNKLYVRFETTSEEPAKFLLTYKTNCTVTLTDLQGDIESPNFPNYYPNNLLCEWTILTKKSKTINIIVSHLELEGSESECYYDKLNIMELKNNNTEVTHNLCNEKTKTIISAGDAIKIEFTTDYSNGDRGFRIEYIIKTCGEYLKKSRGYIESSNKPYSNNLHCMWTIEADFGEVIQLNVTNNYGLENCDWLEEGLIISNDKLGKDLITKTCTANNFKVVSNGRFMYINFITNEYHKQKYFKASYNIRKQGCGGHIFVETNDVYIKTPTYPFDYPPDIDCEWIVSSLYSKRFQLNLRYADIEQSSNNCEKDYIEIYDSKDRNEDKLLLKHCGNEIPKQTLFNSSSGDMLVRFHSDNSTEKTGFEMVVTRLCGLNAETKSEGFIMKKKDESNCVWNIKSINGDPMSVRFSSLSCVCGDTDEATCEQTKGIQIYEDEVLRASFCKHPPHVTTSTGDSLKIYARDGVKTIFAVYSIFKKICNGRFTSIRGQIASPQYPNYYKPGYECVTAIKANKGNIMQITFKEFDLIKSDHCNEDYVEIREGQSSGKLISVLCGNDIVNKTFDIHEIAWIKFRSSPVSIGGKGFLAHYEYKKDVEISTEDTEKTTGIIANPPLDSIIEETDPYRWRILTKLGNRIIFNFKEYSQGLVFYDGYDETAGTKEIEYSPFTIISTSNFAYIVSENAKLHQFQIEWKIIDQNDVVENKTKCGGIIEIDADRNFTSPNYPKPYESNTHCEWIIKPKNQISHALLTLYAADLEHLSACYADYLKIFSSEDLAIWTEEKLVCNLTFQATAYFTVIGKPFLKVILHSDSYSEGTGFMTRLRTGCGGSLTDSAGVIDSGSLKFGENSCAWKIKVQRGRKIQFKFDFDYNTLFDFKENDNCKDGYIILRNGIDEDAPIISPGRLCSQNQLNDIELMTQSNVAYVKYTLKSIKAFSWKLTYKEHNECGDEIHLNMAVNSTTITSPNYPKMPHPFSECIWTFTSPPATTINVNFTEFSVHCLFEYLQIRDGSTNLANEIGRYCKTIKQNIQSSGNTLWIKYFSNTSEPQSHFVANVSIAKCFNLIDGYYSGEIKSLNYPAKGAYAPNSECVYQIKTTSAFSINITIDDIHLPYNSSYLAKNDHIKIISNDDSENNVTILYGNETRKYIEFFGNVKIIFVTYKAQSEYRGFKLQFKRFSTCFKSEYATEGELIARKTYRKYFNCRWQITVPKGRIVRAKLIEIQYSNTIQRNIYHKIRFFNDFNARSLITELRNASVDFVNSTDNRMLIRLDGGYPSKIISIKIKYDSYGVSDCLGDFNVSINEQKSLSISDDRFSSKYFCSSNIFTKSYETIGFHVDNLLLIEANGIGPAISFRSMYSAYKNFRTNLTNYDLAISQKSTSQLEIYNSGAHKIFNFQFSIKKHQCGNSYVYDFNLTQLDLPKNLPPNYGRIDCAWTINFIYLYNKQNLTFLTNFTNNDCSKEYLIIYNGKFPSDMPAQKLCGIRTYHFTPDGRSVLIHYHSENYTSNSKLNITKEKIKECSRDIRPSVAGTTIEFDAKDYENNLECIWNYRGVKGFSVALQFYGRFFIPSNPNCTDDYLEIKRLSLDNKWIEYPRFCGRESPNILNATSFVYQLKFRSNDQITGDGFSIKFIEYCGGVYNVTNNIQTINSPKDWFTTKYKIKCNYTLETDSNNYIMVKFNKFKLGKESSRFDCYYSKMSLYYEKAYETKKINEYCEQNSLTELKVKKFVTFVYESQLYSDDFSFDFYLESCGGNVTESTTIHSPLNEDGTEYPGQMYCIWNITAPPNKDVAISFNYLIYEQNYKCQDDYVAIYNSSEIKTEFRKLLICGNHTGTTIPVTKTSNKAIIVTKSDQFVSAEGFSADITFVPKCDTYLNLTVDKNSYTEVGYYFTNNERYENNLDCHMYFTTTPGFQISIEFINFDVQDCSTPALIQNSTEKCNCDYLEIFDNTNVYRKSLGKFCGNQSPKIIQSSKQDLSMRFVTDKIGVGTGFKYELKRQVNACGEKTITLEENGNTTLSLQNSEYLPNLYCEWNINTNKSFEIKFVKFDLEDPAVTGLCNDYLDIVRPTSGVADEDLVYCSNKIPANLNVYVSEYLDNKPKIIFRSNTDIQKSGFILHLTNVGICNNRTHNETNGFLDQSITKKCRFNIEIEEHKTLAIYFTTRTSKEIKGNCTESIKFFDTKSNELLQQTCIKEYYTTGQVFDKTNKVTVEIDVSSEDNPLDLNLFYMGNTNGLGCGGEIHGLKGRISSPMYPNNFRNYTECKWIITAPTKTFITINFNEFDMGSKKNCQNDYLQLIDVFPTRTEVAEQLCGGDLFYHYTSKTNKLIILYKRTVNFDGRGWFLNFDGLYSYQSGKIIV